MKKRFLIGLLVAFLLPILAMAACAPSSGNSGNSQNPGEGKASAASVAWSIDSDCESCHAAEVSSGTDTKCTYSLHTTVGCTSCHTDDGGTLTTGHAKYDTADQPKRLKKTEVTSKICESCHNLDELKTATAGLTMLTDLNGTTVNPHDMPATGTHQSSVMCSSCHKMHKTETATELSTELCTSCHHSGVYECGTCHE